MWKILFKALTIVGIVWEWSNRALVDGRISSNEAVELGIKVAIALGVQVNEATPDQGQDET